MKYELSFCGITQLSGNVFETIDREGIIIDKKSSEEAYKFWDNLRTEEFNLLVNCKNVYQMSFEGSQTIGCHPLQNKTAILVKENSSQASAMKTTVDIKKAVGTPYNSQQFFTNRNEALEWLNT